MNPQCQPLQTLPSRPGDSHGGRWSVPRWLRHWLLALALISPGIALACSNPHPESDPSRTPSSKTVASTTPSPSAEAAWTSQCIAQVTYWTVRLLDDPDHSYDYQEMGLSGQTYEALREVLQGADGRHQSRAWVERRSTAICATHARRATAARSTGTGWP